MSFLINATRIVIKVGSSTLTHSSGRLNLRRIESLAKTLSDLKNADKEIILVSSGAVSAGIAKAGLGHRPSSLEEKQAMASIGQSELMKIHNPKVDAATALLSSSASAATALPHHYRGSPSPLPLEQQDRYLPCEDL